MGSLVAATGSYLDARVQGGQWLLRMEDLDPPREMPGAADDIIRTLAGFGFEWDGEIVYQSQRLDRYRQALDSLSAKGLAYPCSCTRKEIAAVAINGIDGAIYPGSCRHGLAPGKSARAWRLRVSAGEVAFEDRCCGPQMQDLERQLGDFVLLRADGYFAYQLAVVVDDAAQGISDVVRGADLLDSTPRQIYLARCLGLPALRYAHLPLVVNEQGEKLSKQTRAPALSTADMSGQLWQALAHLRQSPPADLRRAPLAEIWQWAGENWQLPMKNR